MKNVYAKNCSKRSYRSKILITIETLNLLGKYPKEFSLFMNLVNCLD